ncbi:unnamed protein product [Paramecium octaurelia]|uniref:Uncharacterized protein n=1 Tax=Paramecium octaurelia TaxID=43137 RepID=A0A8S1WD38_PAROT|nr:unnamed protein product [Paramecium octaurelia]
MKGDLVSSPLSQSSILNRLQSNNFIKQGECCIYQIQLDQKIGQKSSLKEILQGAVLGILKGISMDEKNQCQTNPFEQTITLYQQHASNLDQVQQKILNQTKNQVNSYEQLHVLYQILINSLSYYIINMDNKSKQMKTIFDQLINKNESAIANDKVIRLEAIRTLGRSSKTTLRKQREINEIHEKLKQKEKDNLHCKLLFDNKLKKQQIQQDKMRKINKKQYILQRIKVYCFYSLIQCNEIAEINKKMNQKELEIKGVYKQLGQINQVKLENENLQNYYYQKRMNTQKGVNCYVSEGWKSCLKSYKWKLVLSLRKSNSKDRENIICILNAEWIQLSCWNWVQRYNIQKQVYKFRSWVYVLIHQIINRSYLIRENGFIYSHHNNNIQMINTYLSSDVIKVEWIKQCNPLLEINQKIDTSLTQELYPCVNTWYNSKIKILYKIPDFN